MAQRREGEEDPHLRRVEDQLYIAMKKWVVDQLAMTRWQSDNPTSLSNHCAGVITNKYICRHFSYSANFTHMLCTWSTYSEWIFTVSLQSQDICKEGLRASLVELYLHFTFRKYNMVTLPWQELQSARILFRVQRFVQISSKITWSHGHGWEKSERTDFHDFTSQEQEVRI